MWNEKSHMDIERMAAQPTLTGPAYVVYPTKGCIKYIDSRRTVWLTHQHLFFFLR